MKLTSSLIPLAFLGLCARGVGSEGPIILAASRESGEAIRIQVGHSSVLKAPWKVKRVSVTDPEVADVQVLTPEQVLVLGKSVGTTDIVLWSEAEDVWKAPVVVAVDMSQLTEEIRSLFPGSDIELSRTRDAVVVRGLLARVEHAEELRRFLEALGITYVDLTSVAGIQQVQIQVRVAEVSRTAIRALGINAFQTGRHFFGGSTIGPSSGGALNPINIGPPAGALASDNLPFIFNTPANVNPLVTLFTGIPDADLQFFIQALAENQYLRVLAEPNLVALSGEEANFLAGGEYPIPVVQGGIGTQTSITIEYKEFGVRLRFRPVVLGENRIRLLVAPEVSDLTDTGAVEIQGFRVPALRTRRAETTLELQSGQTFAMAGLLNRKTDARTSSVPILGEIPILGALFRSVRYQSGDTELVVFVSAALVEPDSAAESSPAPGESHAPPSDWELFVLGKIEGEAQSKPLPPIAPLVEPCLDRLRGPGGWAVYGRPGSRSASTLKPSPAAPETSSDRPQGDPLKEPPTGPPLSGEEP